MKEFIRRRKNLLIGIACVIVLITQIILFPRYLDFIYFINNREYEPGIYEYYDVAVEHMKTSEEIKERYGEDFTFYLMEMKYTKNHSKNEGDAKVRFWIKGRGHWTVYLEWQDNEWVVVDVPKKWRD